jgi:hypothetical protein
LADVLQQAMDLIHELANPASAANHPNFCALLRKFTRKHAEPITRWASPPLLIAVCNRYDNSQKLENKSGAVSKTRLWPSITGMCVPLSARDLSSDSASGGALKIQAAAFEENTGTTIAVHIASSDGHGRGKYRHSADLALAGLAG